MRWRASVNNVVKLEVIDTHMWLEMWTANAVVHESVVPIWSEYFQVTNSRIEIPPCGNCVRTPFFLTKSRNLSLAFCSSSSESVTMATEATPSLSSIRLNGNTTVVRYLEDTWAVVESCLKLWEILPKHPKTAQIAKGVAYDIFLANLAQIIN